MSPPPLKFAALTWLSFDAIRAEACRKISEQRGVKYDPPLTFLVW